MEYDPQYHNRKSNRLQGYDYSQAGAYFITICTYNRQCLFGHIEDDTMILNDQGMLAYNEWLKTEEMRETITLDVFVVMPNHMHGIIVINHKVSGRRGVLHTPRDQAIDNEFANSHRGVLHTPGNKNPEEIEKTINIEGVCNTPLHSPSETVGAMVRGYKSSVTKKMNHLNHCNGIRCWQRNFHDHIIRDESSYQSISNYIISNPANWKNDRFYNDKTPFAGKCFPPA